VLIAKTVGEKAMNDLAHFAEYLTAAVDGEERHEHGRTYVRDYKKILNNNDHGIFWILCQLHRLETGLKSDGDSPWLARSAGVSNLRDVQNNSIRHYRDYVVLRDLKRFLHRLRVQVHRLR
jgi:hypothetical protein